MRNLKSNSLKQKVTCGYQGLGVGGKEELLMGKEEAVIIHYLGWGEGKYLAMLIFCLFRHNYEEVLFLS